MITIIIIIIVYNTAFNEAKFFSLQYLNSILSLHKQKKEERERELIRNLITKSQSPLNSGNYVCYNFCNWGNQIKKENK